MKKGPKQPRTKREVLDRIVVLALDKSNLLGKQVEMILRGEFDTKDVPGLRTIQLYMSNARQQAVQNVQEQAWSLATMDKAGIPWEAVYWLRERYIDCKEHNKKKRGEDEQLWPWTNLFAKEKSIPGAILTNRQAKWLWRIHKFMPELEESPGCLLRICQRADEYAHREMTSEYLGQDFDTSDLDGSFMFTTLKDIRKRKRIKGRSDMR